MSKAEPFATLRAAAMHIWRDYGAWVYDTWAAINREYFAGELAPPGIVFGLPPHARRMGNYETAYNLITLHNGLLEQDQANLWGIDAWVFKTLAWDVLLHEMIHQRVQTSGCDYGSHNNDAWVAEVNRIAPRLGLPPNAQVIPQMKKGNSLIWVMEEGAMHRRELSRWPYLSRPRSYYPSEAWGLFGERLQGG